MEFNRETKLDVSLHQSHSEYCYHSKEPLTRNFCFLKCNNGNEAKLLKALWFHPDGYTLDGPYY